MSAAILNFTTKYSLYSGPVIFTLGVVGNTINILVFTQLKLFRDNRCAFYLTVESISNFFYLVYAIVINILVSIYGDDATGRSLVWCKLKLIIAQTFALVTFTMISCAAADQYFSTNYRLNLRQMCTMKLARCLTCVFFGIWLVHSIVLGLFFDIVPSVGCVISNPIYFRYVTFFIYPALVGLLPVTIPSFFSLLAYRNVRRIVRRQLPIIRRRLDRQMTAMFLIRVIVFCCLGIPYSSYRIYALNSPVPRSKPLEFAIAQLLQAVFMSFAALNFAASFYVFVISSSRFRRQVKFLLVKIYWKRWKYYCCCQNNQIATENDGHYNSNMELEDNV